MKSPIPSVREYADKDEAVCLSAALGSLPWDDARSQAVHARASGFVETLRGQKRQAGELESFLQTFSLSTDEGIALMCLAEALMRVPDKATANKLIKDKVTAANWGESKRTADWIVKTAGMGLLVTRGTLESVLERIGAPFIRAAMSQAMSIMGAQFVLGQSIEDAQVNAKPFEGDGYRMSYDVLGEGARTAQDAERYFEAYLHAIESLGAAGEHEEGSGISVKLSALHPRYELAQAERCIPVLVNRLGQLCAAAARHDLSLTVDAEEVERLELSFVILDEILERKDLREWQGLGLAVQAYQKRALPLLDELADRARLHKRRLNVRLVKGAYWDREIKRAQVLGLVDYPVFTRKSNTDVSYLACGHKLLSTPQSFLPMFGTHNAQSVAAILEMAEAADVPFVLQRLHGMGEALFAHVMNTYGVQANIYAPVGPHEDLLAYLVRRLLENGANSSFVHQILDEGISVDTVVRDPVLKAQANRVKKHASIEYPEDMYRDELPQGRVNSKGLDWEHMDDAAALEKRVHKEGVRLLKSAPPVPMSVDDVPEAFERAMGAFAVWNGTDAERRADMLERLADMMEDERDALMGLLMAEAHKTIPDAISEVREAIDFCRYYAAQGREMFSRNGHVLAGPTGEDNRLYHEGRGVFVCISPWNFPLAIFTGQVVAALMAGNPVIAKPAEQTSQIALYVAQLIYRAGVPKDVFQCAFGMGAVVGAALIKHEDVGGVAFTGSTEVAKVIQRDLAAKDGPIVPLIAETGGQNVMIVDSSALPEQVVDDVVLSAFGSAGQRCSALRVLCVQEDIADGIEAMLAGAMAEMRVGDPGVLSSDLGPVIDAGACGMLSAYQKTLDETARLIARVPMDGELENETYFAPCAYGIEDLSVLGREMFGPILHVVRYKTKDLNDLIDQVNGLGYGLTCGVHSRIEATHELVARRVRAGNVYINRSMIGAVVGSQPFGGMGLSGTGPKAGGPNYLHGFATEKTVSIDTTASGGNISLVSMGE